MYNNKNVNNDKITKLFSTDFKLYGDDEKGSFPINNGGYIARIPVEYMFSIPFRLEKYFQKSSGWDVPDAGSPTLIEASQIFGFFALGGFIKSNIWQENITEMLINKEDWFVAGISLLNTMGYGFYQVEEYNIMENRIQIKVSLRDSIEASLYLKWYNHSITSQCYVSVGLLSSLANLIYIAEIDKNKDVLELTIEEYEKIFNNLNKFECKEINCISNQSNNSNKCLFIVEN